MGQSDTVTARNALLGDLNHVGMLYTQKAHTLNSIADRMDQMESNPSAGAPDDFPLTAEEARDRASYATMCADFVAAATYRLNEGEYDWEFLTLVTEFVNMAAVPNDPATPSAS